MSIGILAKRYARALLQIGLERKLLDRFRRELDLLVQVFNVDKRLLLFMQSPSLEATKKDALLDDLVELLQLSTEISHFLGLLRSKGRIRYLPQIERAFEVLADAASGIQRVTVTTAEGLQEDQRKALTKILESRQGLTVILQEHTDPSVIGGLRVVVNGQVLDGTVRKQLERMAETITEGR